MSTAVRRVSLPNEAEVAPTMRRSKRVEALSYGQELDNGVACLEIALRLMDKLPEKDLWKVLQDPLFQAMCSHQQRLGREMLARIEELSVVARPLERSLDVVSGN